MIRYFYKELTGSFLFIALELCPASLADVIEKPVEHRELGNLLEPKKALGQITSGLRHLHSLSSESWSDGCSVARPGIGVACFLLRCLTDLDRNFDLTVVHRDIKPQNILVSRSASGRLKMLLSDFGLSKRLDSLAQTSFSQTVNNPGGTVGWRAPEILRGDVTLEPGSESSESSLGPNGGSVGQSKDADEPRRLTRAVDIFALGCLA